MSTRHYPAAIDREGDLFGISFPDFPGCVSSGCSLEEAIAGGTAALALHLAGMAEDGAPIPDPSPLAAVTFEADETPAAVVLIPARIAGRAKRINVTLPEDLIARIDAHTGNRSAFLAAAADRLLSTVEAA